MAGKKTAVFGIYSTTAAAEHAVDTLTKSGFPISDISLLVPETLGSREMGTQKASKAPEGAAAGATSGAVLGGTLGLLAGIGALAIPGVGPFIAAGPIMATLAGLGVGGAVGGLAGSSSVRVFPNLRPNVTKDAFKKAGSCFQSIAILP